MAVLPLLAAEGGDALQLLPEPDEFLYGSLMFLVLFLLLTFFVFPKVRKGMAERSAKIQGQIEEAERTRREADETLEQYRRQVTDARGEGSKIIEEARRSAEAQRAEILQKAEAEAAQILERARAEVAGERERAVAELRQSVGTISLDIASKVIGQQLQSGDAHKQLVDQAIAQLGASRNN
jgi:F-type H+-transporting ATPase subunit b